MKWVKDIDDELINMAYVEKLWVKVVVSTVTNKTFYTVKGLMGGDTLQFSVDYESEFEAKNYLKELRSVLDD